MNIQEIEEEIERIKEARGDQEIAHLLEGDLWHDVLGAIADGADNPQELAAKCLETTTIEFDRWRA